MKNLNISVKLTLLACALLSQVAKADNYFSLRFIQLVYNTTDKPIVFDSLIDVNKHIYSGFVNSTVNKITTVPPKSFVAVPVKFESYPNAGGSPILSLLGLVWSSSLGKVDTNVLGVNQLARRTRYAGRLGETDTAIFATDAVNYRPLAMPKEVGIGALTRLLEMGLKDVSNISADPVIKKALGR